MNEYYNPLNMRDFFRISNLSFSEYVAAITSKRHKHKTVKRNKKSKKNRR